MRFLNSILTTLCLLIATAIAASVDDIDSTATDVRTLAADNDQPTPQVAGEAAPQRDMVFLYHKREGRSPPAQDNPPLNNKCTRLWGDCYTYVLWGDTRCILYKDVRCRRPIDRVGRDVGKTDGRIRDGPARGAKCGMI